MNEHSLDKIDRYLEGKMSEEEKVAFEAEAAGNQELSSLLAVYSGIETEMRENAAYNNQEAALRQTLGRLNATYFTGVAENETEQRTDTTEVHTTTAQDLEEETGEVEKAVRGKLRSINIRRLLLVAAACTGIIVLGITFWNSKHQSDGPGNNPIVKRTDTSPSLATPRLQPDTPALAQRGTPGDERNHPRNDSPGHVAPHVETVRTQRPASPSHTEQQVMKPGLEGSALFAANFKPDAAPASEERPDALDIAFDLYEEKDYKNAATAFGKDEVSRGEEEDKKLIAFYRHYYQAQIYLAGNNASKALPELATALKQGPDAAWKVKTQWYLALAYLKNGEQLQATNLLEKISRQQQDETLRQKATSLLTEMKMGS